MIVVLLLPRESEELVKRVTLLFTLIPLALAVYLFIILRPINRWHAVRRQRPLD